jgi:pSer/pThr/pTyr-binding forkhead associated (FHA) protein
MYQLSFKDNSQPRFNVSDSVCTIGRAVGNSLTLTTSTVSEQHAKLIMHEGRLFLQDNKSTYGSFVNGKKVKYKELQAGDVITLGNVHFDITEVEDSSLASTQIPASRAGFVLGNTTIASKWKLVSDSSWLAGKAFELNGDVTVLGRGKDCGLLIPGTHLSRHHAELRKEGSHLILRDLNSANGSFVNEVRVAGEQRIRPGDRLRFDVYSFRVHGPAEGDGAQAETSGPRKILNLESTLQNIEALKSQEYQQKEWVTKPTSHGNRYHEVPMHGTHHFGAMFWFSVILGLSVLGVLGYIVVNL